MPQSRKPATRTVNPVRHESQCRICVHPQRAQIDLEFVNWTSPTRIATKYRLSRDSVYRHARATGLFPKRQRNVRAALEKIIEKAGEVKVNASVVVSAVSVYARINSAGQWVARSENVDLNELFERMTQEELNAYAQDGTMPAWFPDKPRQELKEIAP